jgi:hypothetical protein
VTSSNDQDFPEPEIWAYYSPYDAVFPAQDPLVQHALSDARHDLRIATAIGLIGRNT